MLKKNIIAFSLYGSEKKFLNGAIANAELAQEIYPEWQTIFYCGRSVSKNYKRTLLEMNSTIFEINEEENYSASLWRFRAIFLKNADHIIFRDCDSRLSHRESQATNEWIISATAVHIMRDHPNHDSAIMAGMCGLYAPQLKINQNQLLKYQKLNYYGVDQDFLRREIYKKEYSRLIHDSFKSREEKSQSFGARSNSMEFIGEIYDENNLPILEDREILRKFERNLIITHKVSKWEHLKLILYDLKLSLRIFLVNIYFMNKKEPKIKDLALDNRIQKDKI